MVRCLWLAVASVAVLSAERTAQAASHYLFVTSSTHNGNLGGLAGADALCQQHAASGTLTAPLNRTWKALLSVNGVVSAKDRVAWSGDLYEIGGLLVTSDPGTWPWASGGTSTLRNNENGAVSAASYAWTGSTVNGVAKGAGFDCSGWTSAQNNGWAGETGNFPASSWIDSFAGTCSDAFYALYCVSVFEPLIFSDGFEGGIARP